MSRRWGSSGPGKLFTSTPHWSLELDGESFVLQVNTKTIRNSLLELEHLEVTPGAIWSTLTIQGKPGQRLVLDGIPNLDARQLKSAVESAIADIHQRARVADLLRNFHVSIQPVLVWSRQLIQSAKDQLQGKGWLTQEFVQRQEQSKPSGFEELLKTPEVAKHIESQSPEIQEGIKLWKRDLREFADNVNHRHKAKQTTKLQSFFQSVEKSPLTQEQVDAVVCFDNRVLLVASAGSGKTSTMVAKAGYALRNGYFQPEQMLLLAFNNDAAKELGQRVKDRLLPLGLPAEKVVAKTFHAFGLNVIGQATGRRPSLARWVESGKDLEHLLQIVDDLKDKDLLFRTQWDLFRVVLGQDLPKFGKEEEAPDAWDKNTKAEGFWTLNNEVVKSRGEQLIANWLFYNGVKYEYEAQYQVDTADAQYRQYQPDFYFPGVDAYLEHWAVDENGEPPKEFVGYKEGMAWKRKLHATNNTRLLETTMAELWSGKAFKYLETELTKLGVILAPNPDRPAPGRKPIENPRLARTFRSFMTHAKSNRLSAAELRSRLHSGVAGQFRFRHMMFLNLFDAIAAEWEVRLRQASCVDFEDMLNLAADCIEQGKWNSPYELVMVDEFQDASQARARLVAGLVKGSNKHLFAVGDDWQSINRFAGADLAVMTDFEQRFGPTVTMKLETTFRCPQSLCDISSSFVRKNPRQIRKSVRSKQGNIQDPVTIIRVDEELEIRDAIAKRLTEIAGGSTNGRKQRILLLGRYQKDRNHLPTHYDDSKLEVEFITVHASKGLEADHVLIPRMTSETLGFPSKVADDPVLQLAMPGGDSFEYAEERRLFYVALTRARISVTLFTISHKESPFITELVRDHRFEVKDSDGLVSSSEICPTCGSGFLVQRKGKYGPFMGCSSYPRCRHTRKLVADSGRQ
jgi:DNA helicase IV